jgi:uncharacterized membrane protein YdbT with pleckstrin-like domain
VRGIGFPASQLASNEDVVLHLRPHWIALVKPVAQTALIGLGLAFVWLFVPERWGAIPYAVSLLAAIVFLLVFPVRPLIAWATTHIVVTNERVIRKSRWLGIEWIEISLDKITDVRFTQNPLERIVRAGDIRIESAGRSGQEVFLDLPHPERVQRLLSELREVRSESPVLGIADELTKLQRLRENGVLTEAEFLLVKQRILARA